MNKNSANTCIWNTGKLVFRFADFSFILEKSFFKTATWFTSHSSVCLDASYVAPVSSSCWYRPDICLWQKLRISVHLILCAFSKLCWKHDWKWNSMYKKGICIKFLHVTILVNKSSSSPSLLFIHGKNNQAKCTIYTISSTCLQTTELTVIVFKKMNVKINKYTKLIYKIKVCLQRRPSATIIVMSKRNWGDMKTNKVMFTQNIKALVWNEKIFAGAMKANIIINVNTSYLWEGIPQVVHTAPHHQVLVKSFWANYSIFTD